MGEFHARLPVVEELATAPSTNAVVMERLSSLSAGSTVFTMNQTAGRGRLDRSWNAVAGETLAMSVLLNALPTGVPSTWIPLLAGVCVKNAVRDLGVLGLSLKWPNDVTVGGKKLSGVLVEATNDSRFVVGIGINVYSTPESLPDAGATSLHVEGVWVEDVRVQLVEPLASALGGLLDASAGRYAADTVALWHTMVRDSLDTVGRTVVVQSSDGTSVTGVATGLATDGGLTVALGGSGPRSGSGSSAGSGDVGGLRTIHSGDVFHIARS
jgi:BirA family biotin operon repressor/biotin-[acetyl-CoA-carboxylase] ligase